MMMGFSVKKKIKSAVFINSDEGKSGKTPESEKFYHLKVMMLWLKDQSAAVRRANRLTARGGNTPSTAGDLHAPANVTTDAKTAALAKADADHFFRHQVITACSAIKYGRTQL